MTRILAERVGAIKRVDQTAVQSAHDWAMSDHQVDLKVNANGICLRISDLEPCKHDYPDLGVPRGGRDILRQIYDDNAEIRCWSAWQTQTKN